ncbi:MAG: histidine phosphatase family protein [Christensenellales bacterium]|jgi:broad specificity phosphatase PhoE
MILHLIRHGKTYANEQRLYCGQTDLPLSDTGAAEITQLARAGIYPARDGLKMYIVSPEQAKTSAFTTLLSGFLV